MTRVLVDGAEFRVDVFTDDWRKALVGIEKVSISKKMIVDGKAVIVDGEKFRVDVFTNQWDSMIQKVKKVKP
jgi:hypothetical protein